MAFTIKHLFNDRDLFTSNTAIDLATAVREAVKARADLNGANLSYANLSYANLSRANLSGADLSGAINADWAIAQTRILPDGDLIGWKKLANGVIAKLLIPANAKRSHAFGRKCRAEYAVVLEGEGASQYDKDFLYAPGAKVAPDKWCDDWMQECAGGIHFFISKIEAENY